MCGLYGSTLSGAPDPRHTATLETLVHRGPDQSGVWHDDAVFMGHRRLSIIDLSESGRQPMVTDSPPVVVSVNGEIYNFKDLRRELESGANFHSNSDSEVILHGYAKWGLDGLLARLEGMFAVVIYDRATRELHLARDRIGIKPLYYALKDGEFVWASELQAVAAHFGRHRLEADLSALYDFLTYLYVPAPKSAYRDVFKVQPAHVVTLKLADMSLQKRRYWDVPLQSVPIGQAEASTRLRQLLQESVSEQLVSDVDVGYFLSGGLDSSTVVAFSDADSSDNRTFAIGFDDVSHNETEFARLVADHCGLRHNEITLTEDAMLGLTDAFLAWFAEPFADTSAFPTFLVSEFARQKVKVVLTGDGGDEVFGGYKWYRAFHAVSQRNGHSSASRLLGSMLKQLPVKRASFLGRARGKVLREVCLSGVELYAALMGGLIHAEKGAYRERFGIPKDYDDYWHFRRFYRPDLPLFKRLQYLDLCTYLPDDILTKVDRTSMAVSLEARVPLLSTRLVELKGLLKHAVRDKLPKPILDRGKKGFSVPERSWKSGFFRRDYTKQENVLRAFNDRYEWAAL